ncbi:MAG: MoxR family ATPase, partial [Planctomycetota bacterium]|nr:MoxR family ATPase [Planctomycetota bacterium]
AGAGGRRGPARAAGADPLDRLKTVMSREELRSAMNAAAGVHVAPPVEGYILDLVAATRDPEQFELGASPRATLDLDAAARAHAHLDGRSVVIPSDVRDLAPAVLGHRVVPLDMVAPGSSHAAALLDALLDTVPAPRLEDDGSLRA